MKVKDIIKLITDPKLYIEIVDEQTGASYGFFTKNELMYKEKYNKCVIKKLNTQYYNNKRLLVLTIDY